MIPSHTERQYIPLWPKEAGWNPHLCLQWRISDCDSWSVFVLLEPRKQTDANCNTGIFIWKSSVVIESHYFPHCIIIFIEFFSKVLFHFSKFQIQYFFITFQLRQQPSEMNPIFLPSDLETDWLLAKMFIKNADALDHEAAHHLLNTHFMGEVYMVATLRCFPVIHPLYKVRPHSRDHSARTCVFLLDLNSCFTGLTGQVVVHERNLFCYGCVFSLLIHTARMCCLLFNSLFVINLSHKRGRIWYGSGKNPFLL